MKGFFKPKLILPLVTMVLLIGALVGPLTFSSIGRSHAAGSGELHNPPQPPQVTFKTNSATGKSDPVATIKQGCPATAPINSTPFSAGDVITITSASFTSTDSSESTESEEANNALGVFDTPLSFSPVFVKLNQTTSFTFTATAGDQLKACFIIYDGDEVGTIDYTVTPKSQASKDFKDLTETVGDIVAASNKICDVLKCSKLAKIPLDLLDKIFTIFNFGQVIADEKILGDKLAALNAAIKQFGVHSHQACVAADAAYVANRNLHADLVGLVPGLEFIFPVPLGGPPPCR